MEFDCRILMHQLLKNIVLEAPTIRIAVDGDPLGRPRAADR